MRPNLLVLLLVALSCSFSTEAALGEAKKKQAAPIDQKANMLNYYTTLGTLLDNLLTIFAARNIILTQSEEGDRDGIIQELIDLFHAKFQSKILRGNFKTLLINTQTMMCGQPLLDNKPLQNIEKNILAILTGHLSIQEFKTLTEQIGPFTCCQQTFHNYQDYTAHCISGECEEENDFAQFKRMYVDKKPPQSKKDDNPFSPSHEPPSSGLSIAIPIDIPGKPRLSRVTTDPLSSSPPKKYLAKPHSPLVSCQG